MGTKANTSSVDSGAGMELAAFGNIKKSQMNAGFNNNDIEKKDQVVNARKATNIALAKSKKKKAAKAAKASKKRNKK